MSRLITTNAALATPFQTDGAIDWPRLTSHARELIGRGLPNLTLFGTTGEGASISDRERDGAYDRFAEAGVAPRHLVESILKSAVGDVVRQGRRALGGGCAALLLAPPFYYEPGADQALFAWFAAAIEGLGAEARDVVLYNIPSVTGVAVTPDMVGRLRTAFPGVIAGVKDSSGDFATTRSFLAEHRDLCILVGHEGYLATAIGLGASGSISGIANFAPEFVASLVAGEEDPRAQTLVDAILRYPVVPAVKELLAHVSGEPAWSTVRPPLHSLALDEARFLADGYDSLFSPPEARRAGQ